MLGINFNTDLTKMIKENYMQKVKTLESMIKQWERRSLTPLGKITAIKVLMIPAFNHLFFTLPNPGQPVIDYINSILFNFLWGNKVKIKKNVVIKQYTEGGLKMVNLQAFIEALKLTWIRRLLNTDRKWQDFIKLDLEVEKLVGCNTEYIKKKINKMKNNFWIDVLKGFIKFNEKNIMDEETILKTPIFNNQNIQINGKDIYYDKWFQKGIRFINDLLNENGDFLKYEECSEILGIQTNYLQYSGTVQSIKAYLRFRNITLTHKSQSPFIPSHIFPLIKNKQGARVMYDVLNMNNEIPTGKQTWNNAYNFQEKDWKNIYMYPFKTTQYSQLRWFQIRINHNILVTNKLLKHMKIIEDSSCTFCTNEDETTVHLLWSCNKTQEFLKLILTWFENYNIHFNLSEKLFLFGIDKDQKLTNTLHFFLLYAKYYIYCSRCNNQPLMLAVFKKKLFFMYKMHMEIAFTNNSLETFLKQWSPYKSLLEDISN